MERLQSSLWMPGQPASNWLSARFLKHSTDSVGGCAHLRAHGGGEGITARCSPALADIRSWAPLLSGDSF